MEITKEDIKDIVREWYEDEVRTWESKIEDALFSLISVLSDSPDLPSEVTSEIEKIGELLNSRLS